MRKLLFAAFISVLACHGKAQNKPIDSLKALLSKTTDPGERYRLLTEISIGYYRSGTGESTVDNNLERLRIALQLNNDSLIAKGYNTVGDFYLFEKGDFNTGMDYCFKGIPYAEKANDKRSLSSLYCDISIGHGWLRNQPEELNFLNKAAKNLPDKDHPEHDYMQLQVSLNFAVYYLVTHQPKQALTYLNTCTELNQELHFATWEFFTNAIFGYYYDQIGDKELSAIYYKKTLSQEKDISSPFSRFQVKYYYINHLINNTDYEEAASQSRSILAEGTMVQNNFIRYMAAGLLKNIFDKQARYDSAYYYSRQELALRDTLFTQERLNKIQALAFNEDVRVAEEQVKKLEAEQERKQNIQYALIALGIVTFLILFFVLSHSIIVNEKWISFFGILGLLIVFEFINLLIHPYLERVTHHSPVWMLLALVAIASLLIPLHHRIEKWIKEKMTEKNKKIRLAAAKKTIEKLEKET